MPRVSSYFDQDYGNCIAIDGKVIAEQVSKEWLHHFEDVVLIELDRERLGVGSKWAQLNRQLHEYKS